jgi:hypothetical protein
MQAISFCGQYKTSLLLSFWTLSIVRISTNRKHNVSETDPVSETLCFLFVEIRTMDKVQKLNSNEFKNLTYFCLL